MASRRTCLLLVLALSVQPAAHAQAPLDAEVARGIKQVEDGDLAAAIVTLDAAARRLSADPSRARDLGQAYLHLGIAHLRRGQEILAKARFRDAVRQVPDLSLEPGRFSQRVIELVEAAKKEAAAGASQPTPAASAKRGSKLPRILLGAAAVAGGALALSATGGDEGTPDFARFYGTYPNLTFAAQAGGCAPALASLELSGNADGSGFRINQVFPPGSTNPPITFTGGIESTGHFTGSGGGYSITGQSTGNRIAGSETRQSGGPACTWMFDGMR